MPTGYTAGILDGKITTFEQFATQCMRAVGATIHMREDDMDAKYKPRIPSKYHKKQIAFYKRKLKEALNITYEDICKEYKDNLSERRKSYVKYVIERRINAGVMNDMLSKVQAWQAPTPEHIEFKKFMIGQLQDTIKCDCDPTYYENEIREIDLQIEELPYIEFAQLRKERIEQAERDIEYHIEEYKAEVDRCNESNEWVETLLKSLKQ